MINFKDKTVLITGGTRGIGKSTADLFEKYGANIILTGTNKDEVKKLNKKSKNSKKKYFTLDLAKQNSIDKLLSSIESQKKIDILINNAGINILDNFIDVKKADYDSMLDINLKGSFLIAQYCAKKMIMNNYGRIINICSIWSKITREKRSVYTITKNALHGLTQSMALELGKNQILVNSVSPGFTLTELTKKTNTLSEIRSLESKIPLNRMANPNEIANLVVFLTSNKNTYITGQNIVIDGGYTIG